MRPGNHLIVVYYWVLNVPANFDDNLGCSTFTVHVTSSRRGWPWACSVIYIAVLLVLSTIEQPPTTTNIEHQLLPIPYRRPASIAFCLCTPFASFLSSWSCSWQFLNPTIVDSLQRKEQLPYRDLTIHSLQSICISNQSEPLFLALFQAFQRLGTLPEQEYLRRVLPRGLLNSRPRRSLL